MDGATGAGTPELEVRLLGPIEVGRAGTPVALGGPKPRALLAALALEAGRVVSVDRLVEALWPGDPPETATHAVQVYVSQLRKALGPVLTTRAPGYELELPPEHIDVHRFTRLAQEGRAALAGGDPVGAEGALREALALWRGPALADFLYEPFAQTEIARLEELRTVVLEERIDADLALGRHAELVAELEAIVQAQPLRERPRAQLMLALYRSGRQAAALAAYRAARATLVEELGIDPGPELRELEAAILRQDDALLLEETPLPREAMQFRRLVTILFVDVVESMGLAETLDPEALARVLQSYFDTVSGVLARHGGTVEKYAGDAVMAAFGIPVSHEDDALRAARAALDIRIGVAALNERIVREHGVGLEIRIGIEAGEVVSTPTGARQRLVTGEAVGIAAKLEAASGAGEILVGEIASRLIDHAARLESLGELEVKGLRRTVAAFRLLELEPVAPAFARNVDATFVGRKRELAALRRSLKRAVDGAAARIAVVVAPPGVGKSRLAAEFTRRAKGVTTVWGRCLSYGDGITYWPLREVLAGAEESDERGAILAALEAETPPPAPEIAWLFRRFCEASARVRPFVVVFDDVHWAEPTFLELVEHLADKGDGPILVVCLARDELAETRPEFLAASNADRIELDALSADETEALVDGLGGASLESDHRARVVEAAEGNPLFLEQLLALALEGGLGAERVPETIQALLATRLDRLGPGERAVLERVAVVGKEFTAEDVVALLDSSAAPTVDVHLATLSDRGFVRPRGDGAFGFRHVLVQDAVYRAAPKRLRASLHERYADRLDTESPDLPDLDEFVGYHLEQAYRLRSELGESDRRTEQLAEDGGRRLGMAGTRGLKRGDMHATINLLDRAISLLRTGHPTRRALLCDLGLTRYAYGDGQGAEEALTGAIAESRAASDRYVEAWATIELEYIRLQAEPRRTADALLAATDEGIPILESVGAHRAIGRAWVLAGWLRGGRRGDHKAWEDAAERALVHYKAGSSSTSTCIGQIAAAHYWGATSVGEAISRCEELLRDEVSDRPGSAYVTAFLGGLVGQEGDFQRARALVEKARTTLEDLGLHVPASAYCTPVSAEIETLAGNGTAAVHMWREYCEDLSRSQQHSRLASAAGELAGALVGLGELDEALDWTEVAEANTAADDVHAQIRWCPVRALIHARCGEFTLADELGRHAALLADTTDDLNRRATTHGYVGEALNLGGRTSDAVSALGRAVELYALKGNLAGVALVKARQGDLALV